VADIKKSRLNLPNTLTVIRIVLVPLFVYVLYRRQFDNALAIFAVSAVTDFLDGYFARRFHDLTRLGKILDPIADKLIVVSSFIMFGLLGLIPMWLTILVVVRDTIVVTGVGVLYAVARRFWVDPLRLGKAAIATEFVLLCYMLVNARYGFAPVLAWPLFILTASLSVLSGLMYVIEGVRIASAKEERRQDS
jgi:cardiolipin synthase